MKLKKLVFAGFVSVAALAAASCNGGTGKTTTAGGDTTTSKADDSKTTTKQQTVESLGYEKDYTYNTYSEALGTNWNPHTWEMSSDDTMLGYVSVGFVDLTIKDSKKGEYQWIYEMAESVTDVTKTATADLTKYKSTIPDGETAAQQDKNYVYEIKLNKDAKWQDGTAIKADDYVESMKRLLSPDYLNYRANLYLNGEDAIAGAYGYYYSKSRVLYKKVGAAGYATNAEAVAAGKTIFMDIYSVSDTVWGGSWKGQYTDAEGNPLPQYGAIDDETLYAAEWDDDGQPVGDDTLTFAEIYGILASAGYIAAYAEVGGDYDSWLAVEVDNDNYNPNAAYDGSVGLYKVDDYTIRYVLQTPLAKDYFFTSLTSMWLVNTKLYDECTKQVGTLKTTTYGSSLETTMSYGPYKMTSFQADKQVVYERNEYWYGYQKGINDQLYSVTNFEVDGKKVQQYLTDKIVIDVYQANTAKLKFLAGELDDYAPQSDEVTDYALSKQLYKVDETYTMRLFFNTNEAKLTAMDKEGNENSIVMTNENFRKAMSLAFDRADWVKSTEGYKPATFLMNNLYYYNVFEDPTSRYRSSDQAMQAIVDFYGYEYGDDKDYLTLEEAYDAVTGYNLAEAKSLMKKAYEELLAAGKITAGANVKIKVAWKKAAMESQDYTQVSKLESYIKAAMEGSGFGTFTLEPYGSVADRYGDTAKGVYAIGYGAWGGAAFYPFRNFQVYMDPDQYSIHEGGCWSPDTEELTLTVNGVEETMTWQAWSNCMIGTGKYADADYDTKLYITSQLEVKFMAKYYCIPLATSTSVSLLSYQMKYYTEDYNIMYSFGGLRLSRYVYSDTEWAAYVAEQGGTLNYN